MPSKKNLLILFSLFLILFVIGRVFYQKTGYSGVVLGDKTFAIEVADTDASRQKGLSGHPLLRDDQGMLFVFPKSERYGFWMKEMLFPLDIIWIDSDLRITHIERYLATSTYPKVFRPELPSLYVFEVLAGQSDDLKLKIGDTVKFIKK